MTDNQWTKRMEANTIMFGKLSQSYNRLHLMSIARYNAMDTFIGITAIILSSIVSVGIFVTMNDHFDTFWLVLASALLSVLTTAIKGIDKFMGYQKTAHAHKEVSVGFYNIYMKITTQMSLPAKDRKPAQDFLKKIIQKYNDLMNVAPEIKKSYIEYIRPEWEHDKDFDITQLREINIEGSTPKESNSSRMKFNLPTTREEEDTEEEQVDTLVAFQLHKLFPKK
jgi:hypothetical protein